MSDDWNKRFKDIEDRFTNNSLEEKDISWLIHQVKADQIVIKELDKINKNLIKEIKGWA